METSLIRFNTHGGISQKEEIIYVNTSVKLSMFQLLIRSYYWVGINSGDI